VRERDPGERERERERENEREREKEKARGRKQEREREKTSEKVREKSVFCLQGRNTNYVPVGTKARFDYGFIN
jgi:hypothetical protein